MMHLHGALTSSRGKRLALCVLATTFLFVVIMRSTASGELETDFGLDSQTQSIPMPSQSESGLSKQKEEFIRQQVDFERLLADNVTEPKTTIVKAETGQKQSKTNVLLITAHRSGSTFLGELFNRNNNAFYMFEPLAAVQGPHSTDECDGLTPEKNAYLASLFNCTLPVIYRSVKQHLFSYGGETSGNLPEGAIKESSPYRGKCSGNNLCFRENHRWSCDKAICAGHQTTKLTGETVPRCSTCKPVNHQTMNGLCHERPITALKLIRYCDLNAMELLANNEDVKTIVLFRDPRGIFISRNKIFNNAARAIKTIEKTCKYYHQAVQKVKEKRIFSIRYEDMSSDPLTTAQTIYEFIGHLIPSELSDWIERSTSESASGGTYSTVRNSTATMTAWRKSISFENALAVQNHCADFMRLAGYNLVAKPIDLSNNSYPVFTKWNN